MKVKINIQRIAVSVVLFIIFGYVNAQDTIHCLDERYHWTYECNYSDYPGFPNSRVDLAYIGFMNPYWEEFGKPPVPVIGSQVDKFLVQQIFTDTMRKQIYGIAGTTIECHNPNGCYFYLYKKINDIFVVVDSAEWTHRNTNSAEKKYIAYDVKCDVSNLPGYAAMPTTIEGETLTFPDSNIVEIHEAYFSQPLAVEGEFYIGFNWNGISPFYWSYIILEEPYTSSVFVPVVPSQNPYLGAYWVYIEPDNSVYEGWSGGSSCFFPIIQPPACVPINAVQMDNLTNNSAHISWEQPYLSSYYQIEYGPLGFQHGEGILVDSITATDYVIQGLDAGMGYIAYIRSYCSGTDTMSNWKCIKFKTLHSECLAVEDFGTAHVSDKMVRIEWKITDSEISLCQIEWGEAGFEHGNGTIINNIHDTTYIFRNLTPNTTYDIYLRTYCERSQVFGQWQKLTVTTNGDSTTAISTIDNDIPVELHPNPTSDIITLSRNDIQKVEVMDATGKVVMIVDNKNIIDLSKLTKGYYTLRITTAEGVAIRKVIRN